MKTKIKSDGDEFSDFYDKKIPKVDSNHTYSTVIGLDLTLNEDKNYKLQVFLKECKYIEKKVIRQINDSFGDFSSLDDSDDFD